MVRTSGAAAWRTSQVNDEEDAAAIRDGARGLADARRLATLATRAGYEGNPPQRAEEQNAIVSECLHAPTTACTRSRYVRAITSRAGLQCTPGAGKNTTHPRGMNLACRVSIFTFSNVVQSLRNTAFAHIGCLHLARYDPSST